MAQAHTQPALGYLAGRQLTPVAAVALRIVVVLVKWEERRRTRRDLSRLEAHLLSDVGLTQAEVDREVRRPVWQG